MEKNTRRHIVTVATSIVIIVGFIVLEGWSYTSSMPEINVGAVPYVQPDY